MASWFSKFWSTPKETHTSISQTSSPSQPISIAPVPETLSQQHPLISTQADSTSIDRPIHYASDLTPFNRARKQLTLFFAGSAFLFLSTGLARRAMHKRYIATRPSYYTPNNRPMLPVNAGLDALEALNISTLSVASLAMITVGGWMWALDVVNLEELRTLWRYKVGGGKRISEQEVEEELEEWVATILARKDARQKVGGKENERQSG